jgi:nucleoside phosphorylase
LDSVPELLRNAFVELESRHMDHESKIAEFLSEATARNPRFSAFDRPASLSDNLFKSKYIHVNPTDKRCADCNQGYAMTRSPWEGPLVHFGLVASGNQVIKDGAKRRKILESHPSVIAVEMEAAGLMSVFGCATIRGICDYADSHKNDGWHKYASAVAAAAAKEVLGIIPSTMVVAAPAISLSG